VPFEGTGCARGIAAVWEDIATNIVMFEFSPKPSVVEFMEGLGKAGVKVGLLDGRAFRAVTHWMVSASDIDEALTRIETVCRRLHRARE